CAGGSRRQPENW
nr:immunoglobulin heavy chain junction region [Macaca mulatta]MOX60519.1 immunoglobulin heavy chain junction region [Macaca mulatta]MOX60625.1 immunoglobulin heavy chain junction region [Macaca mulatta]MOX60966.1 immunoglobulin heavy chain junction region [Macaca mulatta]MOX61393.1 immunoglobulin heavy chain junction region [Macaca mulatta]